MAQEATTTTDIMQVTSAMLDVLDARSKDVITRRFGLKSDARETLESIGKEYGITRERVRQIEANAKKALANLSTVYTPAYELFTEVFRAHGGIMTEDYVVRGVKNLANQTVPKNTVVFFLTVLPNFTPAPQSKLFASHWKFDKAVHPQAEGIITAAQDVLAQAKHPVASDELFAAIRENLTEGKNLTDNVLEAILAASHNVDPTVFGQWGLITWPETHPRGVGDKAYAVLRRHGKPSHFREITQLINEAAFDHKKANPQTVHNELIKDGRFILVGRGLYGLKEWGYISGTVADVLEAILKESSQPLSSDELVGRVLKQRIVKKNTILLSLQNNKRFQKTSNGYTLVN